MNASNWATVGTAAFAAVAAAASWASVLQNRRDRLAAQTPDLQLEVMHAIGGGSNTIRIQILNAGGIARLVRFALVEGDQMAYGHPAPTPTFGAGESRIIETALQRTTQEKLIGFVACYNAARTRFYIWPTNGKRRTYRMTGWRNRSGQFSDDALMREIHPGFVITAVNLVRYETAERSV